VGGACPRSMFLTALPGLLAPESSMSYVMCRRMVEIGNRGRYSGCRLDVAARITLPVPPPLRRSQRSRRDASMRGRTTSTRSPGSPIPNQATRRADFGHTPHTHPRMALLEMQPLRAQRTNDAVGVLVCGMGSRHLAGRLSLLSRYRISSGAQSSHDASGCAHVLALSTWEWCRCVRRPLYRHTRRRRIPKVPWYVT
jgi:hypothetical protein